MYFFFGLESQPRKFIMREDTSMLTFFFLIVVIIAIPYLCRTPSQI